MVHFSSLLPILAFYTAVYCCTCEVELFEVFDDVQGSFSHSGDVIVHQEQAGEKGGARCKGFRHHLP